MRNLIALIVLPALIVSCSHHKIVPEEDRQVQYIHDVDLTKNQIFDRTLEWMALTFNDSKAVIEIQDRVNGKIIGKGITTYSDLYKFGMIMPCRFVMSIEIKEKKYRVSYREFFDMKSINYRLKSEPEIASVRKSIFNIDQSL